MDSSAHVERMDLEEGMFRVMQRLVSVNTGKGDFFSLFFFFFSFPLKSYDLERKTKTDS